MVQKFMCVNTMCNDAIWGENERGMNQRRAVCN